MDKVNNNIEVTEIISEPNGTSDIKFAWYSSVGSTVPVETSFVKEMNRIQSGFYKSKVTTARAKLGNKKEYKEYRKESIPCFIVGLKTTGKTKEEYREEDATPLLVVDVDDVHEDPDTNKEILLTFPWVVAVGKSIGGRNLFAIIKCDQTRHKESHDSVIQILKEKGVTVAIGQANPNRLRYISYDPDLYFNKQPRLAPNVPIIKVEKEKIITEGVDPAFISENFQNVYNQIIEQKTDITSGYTNWLYVGFALASEFGEAGRKYFHKLSEFNAEYNFEDADEKYTSLLNSDKSGVTIRTFFHLAKQAGIRIKVKPSIFQVDNFEDCFSDEVYENLPQAIRQICELVEGKRHRDVCLIGIISALSAAFSRYRFYHGFSNDVKQYSPHLMSLVVGAAGSGKGMTRYGHQLVNLISEHALHIQESDRNTYLRSYGEYLYNLRIKQKKGEPTNDLKEPKQPPITQFLISASDATQAGLVEILRNNPVGCFAYDSEVDTLVQGNARKDFGGYSDVIRKAFHHEMISRQRKTNVTGKVQESYVIPEPRLAICLSGTHDQLKKLIQTEANGLFSRFWFYAIPPTFSAYKSANQQEDVIGTLCAKLQRMVHDKADLWNNEIIDVHFSKAQEQELEDAMQDKSRIEEQFGGDINASWLRIALITKRIAVTFAATNGLNKVDDNSWRAACALLPSMKLHCINALKIIREKYGRINISKKEYEEMKKEKLTDEEIAKELNVSRMTLARKKTEWKTL